MQVQIGDTISTEPVAACPYCGGEGPIVVDGVHDWFFNTLPIASDFRRCLSCASLWIADRLSAQDLPRAYSTYYTHAPAPDGPRRPSLVHYLKERHLAFRFGGSRRPVNLLGEALYRLLAKQPDQLDAIYRFVAPPPGRLLDYGCGGGEYLVRMRELGLDVTGVDFDPVAVARVRQAGIAAFTPEEAARQDWQGAFATITLSHVVEHVADPGGLLADLARWLAPGGSMFIEVPNAEAQGLALFGAYWRGLEAPRHLAIPSLAGLRQIIAGAGLRVDRQIVRSGVRSWVWNESLGAVPPDLREQYAQAVRDALPEDQHNAEFLTIVAGQARP